MSYRTDLASEKEQRAVVGKSHLNGVEKSEFLKGNIKISHIKITSQSGSDILEKPMGNYVTLSAQSDFDNQPRMVRQTAQTLCTELKKLCKNFSSVLVVGLGNDEITPDSLGSLVAKNIFATRHIRLFCHNLYDKNMTEVSVITPSVTAKTGLEASEIVKALCDKTSPDLVIVIDALACGEISNLGRTIQLTDTGISPGSGVANARTELSPNTLNTKVVAIGVPTVIDLETAVFQLSDANTSNSDFSSMMVTPRTIDKLMKTTSEIIYTAINFLLHPTISPEDISTLVS